MHLQGKSDYSPRKGFEDRWHVIGQGDAPVLIIKKGEVPKLFNDLFYYIYGIWFSFHYGKGLIDFNKMSLSDDIIEVVLMLEQHFEIHFSAESVMIKQLNFIANKPIGI